MEYYASDVKSVNLVCVATVHEPQAVNVLRPWAFQEQKVSPIATYSMVLELLVMQRVN